MNVFILYEIIIALSVTIHSSLIYEYVPNKFVKELFKKELETIHRFKSIAKLSFGPFNYEDDSGHFSLFNVQQTSFNFHNELLDMAVQGKSSPVLTEKDKGYLVMAYSFNFDCISKGIHTTGTFFMKSMQYSITKQFNYVEDSQFYHNFAFAKFEIAGESITLEDQTYQDVIKRVLPKFLKEAYPRIIAAYNKDVSEYFSRIEIDTSIMKIETYFPMKIHTINLTFDVAPFQENENFWVFSRKGQVSSHDVKNMDVKFEQKEQYQMIIHRQVFYDIAEDIFRNGIFQLHLTQSNHLELYNMDINYAGLIVPELLNSFPRSEKIQVSIRATKMVYNEKITNQIAGMITFNSDVILLSNSSTIFTFQADFEIRLSHKLNSLGFNFFLESNGIKFLGFRVISKKKVANSSLLSQWIESTMLYALEKDMYSFFRYDMNLSEYFSQIDDVKCQKFGYIFIGSHR